MPRFVLQELQSIADSSDKLKRNRGRRGLDMLKRMQNNPKVELQMHEANLPELREVQKVDERLVVLAKVLGARVVTNDFNLNKIAQLQGVEVINLNELANALKSVALPGELMSVRLVKPGDQIGQGVGYLDDGTMVVVEQGRSAHRPGSDDHRDQRAADAGGADDFRPHGLSLSDAAAAHPVGGGGLRRAARGSCPLLPCKQGRGVGGEGWSLRNALPLTPNPSPRSTGERGEWFAGRRRNPCRADWPSPPSA